ncbi:MAG: hypothetical protein JNK49_16665 [Planctomycetes bacterium]|nr:hypothetical protein [Planctomycetota bacterium]
MNDPQPAPTAPEDRELAAWLHRQTAALRRRYLWHGLGLCLLLPTLAIAAAFALDHTLRLPLLIRSFHGMLTAALLGYAAVRFVGYPLRRRARPIDVAALVEQRFPELRQQLVSAVQFADGQLAGGQLAAGQLAGREPAAATPADPAQGQPDLLGPGPVDPLRNQSPAMIAAVRSAAVAAAASLPIQQLFDGRRTRWLYAGVLTTTLALGSVAVLAPATAWAFLLRHFGVNVDYPRATTLRLEVPAASADVQREDDGEWIRLLLPAGADLPVLVTADGVAPSEVFLDVEPLRSNSQGQAPAAEAARSVVMGARGPGRFRHVFRRTTGAFTFHARGGDDDHGDRRVEVRTIHPPQVASITVTTTPPAYTGRAQARSLGGAVEGLVGSTVQLDVATTLPVRDAQLVLLESGQRLPLTPLEVPDDGGTATVLRATFRLQQSDRYQVELLAQNGLRNPNPGTYPITALPDYAPVGRWLLPDDDNTLLLRTGLLCVRLEARDDFGLTELQLAVERGSGTAHRTALLPAPRTDPAAAQGGAKASTSAATPLPTTLLRTELLEVRELLAGEAKGQDSLSLLVQIADNAAPAANRIELPRRIVQVVEPAQLNEAIAKLFRSLREEAQQALDLLVERRAQLQDLLAPEAGPRARSDAANAQLLTGVEVGQGRIGTAVERLHRGLMRAFDLHLWNRLEPSPNAEQVVARYRAHAEQLTEPVAQAPEFYRELAAARSAGTLPALELVLDPILAMLTLADRLATQDAPRGARHLAEAQVARSQAAREQSLQAAAALLAQQEQGLKELLLRLGDWHDYQDLIQEARALRDRQVDLQARTEEAKGKQ